MQRIALLFLLQSCIALISCTPRYTVRSPAHPAVGGVVAPDYGDPDSWAALPYRHTAADSVPAPLAGKYVKDTSVDVFFLHPTTFTAAADTAWNAQVSDPRLNAKTDYSTILYQASAFNQCRVFAPRYRQAHIRAYYTTDTTRAKKAFGLAYSDIRASFQYYLDNYNNGRPVIIASHSQGSTHALHLLKDFFDNGLLQKKLIAAYVIGMRIPPDYFTSLKMCTDSLQTGCVTGWRTYKKGYVPEFVEKENGSGLVTNPLTWTTSDAYADHTLNRGGVISNFNKVHHGIADAQIHAGILWIGQPHIAGSFLLRMKNYHVGDINLFYVNIKDNVQQRITAFKKRNN